MHFSSEISFLVPTEDCLLDLNSTVMMEFLERNCTHGPSDSRGDGLTSIPDKIFNCEQFFAIFIITLIYLEHPIIGEF